MDNKEFLPAWSSQFSERTFWNSEISHCKGCREKPKLILKPFIDLIKLSKGVFFFFLSLYMYGVKCIPPYFCHWWLNPTEVVLGAMLLTFKITINGFISMSCLSVSCLVFAVIFETVEGWGERNCQSWSEHFLHSVGTHPELRQRGGGRGGRGEWHDGGRVIGS